MQFVTGFVRKTIIGGLLFLLPLAVILVLIDKLESTVGPFAHTLVAQMLGVNAVGPAVMTVILCVLLLTASFLAGLLASTIAGRNMVDWLESALLSRVPGYFMLKSMASDAANTMARIETGDRVKVVYVSDGESWKIGFVTDRVGDDLYAIFLPDAPSALSGELVFSPSTQFVDSDLTLSEAVKCLARLGTRSGPAVTATYGT